VISLLAVIAVGVSIRAVRDAAPVTDEDFLVPGVGSESLSEKELEDCERTLPGEPVLPDTDGLRAFGRISSTAVVECPDLFDGRQVTYVGEVVGDILHRDGGAWLLVNDDDYALEVGPAGAGGELRGANSGLAVWLPDPLPDELTRAGGHGWRGDVIEVNGTIHRVDPADGGGLTLRADDIVVLAEARRADPPFNGPQGLLATVLVVVVIAVFAIDRRKAADR
jgi:hypothetical protein